MTRHLVPGLLALAFLAGGCRNPKDERPIAGLHAAAAPVLRHVRKDKKPVAVGAQLRPGDRIEATGPAVLEYFGGGLHFLAKGDELEVGEAPAANLLGPNLPSRRWEEGEVKEAPPAQRIIAARYTNTEVTPASVVESKREATTGELLAAFFSPEGIGSIGSGGRVEGPSGNLPPPPLRPKVPFIHAGPLGEGGFTVQVTDGFVVAEAEDLSTAVVVEGGAVPLGRTVRLLVPKGAELVLTSAAGRAVEVDGPMDLRLR
jgi:hypothetical protein